jgi:diguanylate cyclase (GGDEF)-like protein
MGTPPVVAEPTTIERNRPQVSFDALTGVANRRVLMDRLGQGLRRMRRGDRAMAVLCIDLDGFELVNGSFGPCAADAVFAEVAARLVRLVRPADTVARLGADKLVIVAEGLADVNAAAGLAQRVTMGGRQPLRVGSVDLACRLNVGVVCATSSQRNADALLGDAAMALYRAREGGRGRAETVGPGPPARAGGLVTERRLRRALDGQGVVVQYQPIVDLRSGRPVAAEALLRLWDVDDGLLLPEAFLEVAEDAGLLAQMDEQVLVDAVKQVEVWQGLSAGAELAVAVNLTASHLADAGFDRAIIDRLDAHAVAHHHLQVELTERVPLEASRGAIRGLRALRDAGVKVGLDDFGAGYSSFAYLRRFPLDFVKIDASLVEEVDRGTAEVATVAAIVTLAHAHGLSVVAEGVETERQLEVLQELGCDHAQGFLFAEPAGPHAIYNLVNAPPALTSASHAQPGPGPRAATKVFPLQSWTGLSQTFPRLTSSHGPSAVGRTTWRGPLPRTSDAMTTADPDLIGGPTPRESLLARTLVELADTLVADFDVVELLTLLAGRCVDVLGVSAAGLMLAGPDGELKVVSSSSEAMRVLELFELQAKEGPCLDCYRSGRPVMKPDLATPTSRWPLFAAETLAAGFRSVHALPMRLRGSVIGVLNLFRVEAGEMQRADVDAAQALADIATITILQHRAALEAQVLNQQLQYALNSRIVIEQAKGVVAERAGLNMERAFDVLRKHARDHNLWLVEVAEAVIDGSLAPSALSPEHTATYDLVSNP